MLGSAWSPHSPAQDLPRGVQASLGDTVGTEQPTQSLAPCFRGFYSGPHHFPMVSPVVQEFEKEVAPGWLGATSCGFPW